jgi:hypothetical protein
MQENFGVLCVGAAESAKLIPLGLVRFGPERPGLWPDPPGLNRSVSKPGQIKNDRSVRNGPEYKPANSGLFPPFWPETETGPLRFGIYPGDAG